MSKFQMKDLKLIAPKKGMVANPIPVNSPTPPNRLADLQALLSLHGFDSLDKTGDMILSAKKPIFVPKGVVVLPQSKQVLDVTTTVNIGGDTKVGGKAVLQKKTALLISSSVILPDDTKTMKNDTEILTRDTEVLQKEKQSMIDSPIPLSLGFSRTSGTIPLNVSYLFTNTLTILDNTELVLDGELDHFVIIANQLILEGNNIKITWSQPEFSSVKSIPKCPKLGQAGIAPDIWPIHGKNGKSGKCGEPGQEYAESAPQLEAYFMNISGNFPRISLRGQDGQKGGIGQSGQDGQNGMKGCPTLAGVFCKRKPGQGGNGGNGGNGGQGGQGGNGGNGGKLIIHTTSQNILDINQTGITVDLSGGKGGEGGEGGEGGNGGNGGRRGSMNHSRKCGRGTRTDGNRGKKGNHGQDGQDGMPGSELNNNLRLVPLTQSDFNIALTKPGIATVIYPNSQSPSAIVGDTLTLMGRNFALGDTVLIEDANGNISMQCTTSFIANNMLTFVIPNTIGGKVGIKIKQVDGTLSLNEGTVVISPRIDKILPTTRLRPGSEGFITGTGFDKTGKVTLNGQFSSSFEWIDYNTIKFKVSRPGGIARNEHGEVAKLRVVNTEGFGTANLNYSQEVNITLDTYRIIVFGDSLRFNGGNPESFKDYTLLKNYLETILDIGVYITVEAHQGAKIGRGDTLQFSKLHGEISTRYPTINQQVDTIATQPMAHEVDLVITDGGSNDIPITKALMNNTISEASFKSLIERHMKDDLTWLLDKIGNTFPKAKVLVTSYFQIFSANSNPNDWNLFVIWALINKGVIDSQASLRNILTGNIDLRNLIPLGITKERTVRYNDIWVADSTDAMSRAVLDANSGLVGEDRIYFVDLASEPKHAAFTNESLVWYPNSDGSPSDPMKNERMRLSKLYRDNSPQAEHNIRGYSRLMTWANSSFHPNINGAKRYYEKMKEIVDGFPITKYLSIKSVNGEYVSLDTATEKLVVNNTPFQAAAIIESRLLSSNQIALKAENGKYVCAENGGGTDVNVNRDKPLGWETLEIIPQANDFVAIKTLSGNYLSVGTGGVLDANANTIGSSELFMIH